MVTTYETAPTTIVIFGASGDLTRRKLIPALFSLHCKGRLPDDFRIVGISRSKFSHADFRERMLEGLRTFVATPFSDNEWQTFSEQLYYIPGNLTTPEDFARLDEWLTAQEGNPANRLYYLSTAPRFYVDTVRNLGAHAMVNTGIPWRRVVIEKPFGRDLASAQALNHAIHTVLNEKQIYRIDHYLGKETVQNILMFRFANAIFEPIWNRNYIDHVQITVAESLDVAHRAGYYDGVGVLRDMFQNHLMQVLALVAMEPPASFDADAIRNEKVKAFMAVRPIAASEVAKHTIRGQYRGYLAAEGVAPNSETATYAALRLYLDNWRWQGVPFYLRSGKALAKKTTEIVIQFKRPPHVMFPLPPGQLIPENIIALCLQPDEGIHVRFEAKVPDTVADTRSVDMDFHYADSFGERAIPEAYERLLLDALQGDASLFTRGDSIERAWQLIDPIMRGYESDTAPPLVLYEPGSWGPSESDDFLGQNGHRWMQICGQTTHIKT